MGAAIAETAVAGPDAALLKLIDEVREAHEHSAALLDRLDRLGDENPPPPWPSALIQTEEDARFSFAHPHFVGDPYDPGEWMQAHKAFMKTAARWVADAPSSTSPSFRELISHYQAEDARFLEIKAAMAQWDEDCKQARIRSGYATLERESDAASVGS